MDASETYARQWAKKEDVELETLSEWIKSIGDVVKRRIRGLKLSVNTRSESIFRDPVRELSRIHDNFIIVPADKASNNYTFVCKRHYVDILIEELHSLPGNLTYNLTGFSASEVLDNHKSFLISFGIQANNEELDLPYIYRISKMHKNPYYPFDGQGFLWKVSNKGWGRAKKSCKIGYTCYLFNYHWYS